MWKFLEPAQSMLTDHELFPQTKPCPVCSGKVTQQLFELESPYLAGVFYQIWRCRDCEHRYADGPVSDEVLGQVYGAAFHATSQQIAAGPESAIMQNARRRAEWLHDVGLQGRLLDVGAGRGYFVKAALSHFQATGLDYSDRAAEYGCAIGVTLESGDFKHVPYGQGSFDVMTFWDVLASMGDLHATCRKTAELLCKGGHAVFTVPMGDSLACRLSGKRWPLWIPPVNLHYFSESSLTTLFQQHGLEIVQMNFQTKRVSLNFLLLKLARSMGFRKLDTTLANLPLRWAVPINLKDIKTVLVRRI